MACRLLFALFSVASVSCREYGVRPGLSPYRYHDGYNRGVLNRGHRLFGERRGLRGVNAHKTTKVGVSHTPRGTTAVKTTKVGVHTQGKKNLNYFACRLSSVFLVCSCHSFFAAVDLKGRRRGLRAYYGARRGGVGVVRGTTHTCATPATHIAHTANLNPSLQKKTRNKQHTN